MRNRFRGIPLSVFLLVSLILGVPIIGQATVTGLAAKFDGRVPTNGPGNISGTYPTEADSNKTYTIAVCDVTGCNGNPKVEAQDDPDWIMLHNAKITANHNGVTGHIYFWVAVDGPPTGSVAFTHITNGTLKRNVLGVWKGAVGDWVDTSGFIQHPVVDLANGIAGGWEHISSAPFPPAAHHWYVYNVNLGTVPNLTTSDTMSGITGQRMMKVEMWFYLDKAGDKLTFNPNAGPKIQAAQGGGGEETPGSTGTGGTTCPQCCCTPCKGEPPLDLLSDKLPNVDRFIYKQVPVPILKEYLNEREKEEMNQTK
jgi:hypothetical protein